MDPVWAGVVGALGGAVVSHLGNVWLRKADRDEARTIRREERVVRESDRCVEAFAAAQDGVAFLIAALAGSATFGHDATGAAPVSSDVVARAWSAVTRLQLLVDVPLNDFDQLVKEVADYLVLWQEPSFRIEPDALIARLVALTSTLGEAARRVKTPV